MAIHLPEINGASIVMTGSFNPTIFQPAWFGRQNLLPQGEIDSAEVKVIVPQFSDFETSRFRIQVTSDRFGAVSKPDTNPAPLRDLVLGTFYILEHTPVTSVGLNRSMHFPLSSEDEWHRIGDRLAPKDGWQAVMKRHVGMRALVIQEEEWGKPGGPVLVVKVEPSSQLKNGVNFEINDHNPVPTTDGLNAAMNIIKEKWEYSYNYAAEIADRILTWASE